MPIQKQKKANKLPTTILNYFAAFTETKFNFRTLINYRWTNNELTLDLAIFQDFQDLLLQRIKTGDNTPLTVKNNEHIISLSGDEVLLGINDAISDRFGLDYLKTCVNQEFTKRAERITTLVATEKGVQPAKDADLSKEEIKKHNEQAFHDGCRKYTLAIRKKIELILLELHEKKISRLKQDLGVDHVPSSTFNSANYLKKHFDALQAIAQDNRTEEEYFTNVKEYFKKDIEDIVLYDLFTSIQKYARYNTVGTIYLFFHELNRRTDNNTVEGYPIFFIEVTLVPGTKEVKVSFPRDLLLINTPAVNYFKFPLVLTTSRSSTLKNAASSLGGIEIFLQTQYGWNEPFVLEPHFRQIKAQKEIHPDIKCRIGFQVVRNENKKLLDYSEIMTHLESGGKSKFVNFISDYIDGNVENAQDKVDKEFKKLYPIKSPGRYISDNPLNLNLAQKRILLALNNPKNRIVVVDGPPGTGKSHTIAAITYWANQERKSVVITSHKKQALDVIDRMLTDKFRDLHPMAKPSIIRLAKNGKSINSLENSLQNAVINAAGSRANDYNEQAAEKDEQEFKSIVIGKIEKQLSSSDGYRETIDTLFEFEQTQNSLINSGEFSEDDFAIPQIDGSDIIDFKKIQDKKIQDFAEDASIDNFKDISLQASHFLLKRRKDIPKFLKACEEINLHSGEDFDFETTLTEIPKSFVDLIETSAKLFKNDIPISSLQSGDIPGAFFKRLFRKSPDKKNLEQIIKSLKSLKHAQVIEQTARLKNVPVSELTLGMAFDGISSLRTAISLKKHRDIIDEYREISGNKEKSVSEVYDTLDGVRQALQKVDANLFNSIVRLFKNYGPILTKLQITGKKLSTLSRLNHLTGIEADTWKWIQHHYLLSQKTTLDTLNREDLDAFYRLRQKEVEYQNDLRLKNLNNFLGDVGRIKASFNGGKRLTSEQARVILGNVSGLIAEPDMLSRYFPMDEDLIDLLVIDEASQVSIAASISLILRAKQVVVFGDEYQYGAVGAINVNSKYSDGYFRDIINAYQDDFNVSATDQQKDELIQEVSREIKEDEQEVEEVLRPMQDNAGGILWLKTFNIRTSTLSFTKAIANYTTSLREHYRSFPEIIDYSNEFFYKPAQLDLSVNRIRTKPIGEVLQFIPVETKGNSGSNVNLDEIDAIIFDLESRIKSGFEGSVGIITSFKDQQARMEQALNEKLNMPELKKNHNLTVWFVAEVQGEERDIVYYSFVEDSKYGNANLGNNYPVIGGIADNIRKLKMQRLNVGFSRARDTMIFVHSMPLNKYGKTRLGDALKHYDKLLNENKKNDFFVEDTAIFESPAEKDLYNLLISTDFVKTHREHVKIIPQFKIGEYIRAEYAKQIPRYRVDFLMTFSKGGKEQILILEYDGVEYHTKNPGIVTRHNFTQEYLDYDISRQIELESYGYRFLRLNKFNLRPEQKGETRTDVLDRLLRQEFASE
ncbi:MAG: AAA family ATPase [Deltaproteobacteria bacterium]|nr:AAA family ATPase [Deltaproteobacteria bacterium]